MSTCIKITPELEEKIKNRLKTSTVVQTAAFYGLSESSVRRISSKIKNKASKKLDKDIKPQRVERPPEPPVHRYDYSKLSDEDKRKYETCKRGKKVTRMAW